MDPREEKEGSLIADELTGEEGLTARELADKVDAFIKLYDQSKHKKHKKDIKQLDGLLRDLEKALKGEPDTNTDASKSAILAALSDKFLAAARSKENFTNKLKTEPNDHLFYRGIKDILDTHMDKGGNSTNISSYATVYARASLDNATLKGRIDSLVKILEDNPETQKTPKSKLSIFKTPEDKIALLKKWSTALGEDNPRISLSHDIIAQLDDWFQSASREKKFLSPGNFIESINQSPDEHIFYREIALLLKENYKDEKDNFYSPANEPKKTPEIEQKNSPKQ